jgi:L-asparaginase II
MTPNSGPVPKDTYPEDPVLVQVWRGDRIESQHRGAWVLVDGAGKVIDGAGSFAAPFFARSSLKCVQALPLLESGAADAFGFSESELALALASHNAEACHTEGVQGILERLGLGVDALLCGPQRPTDPEARMELARSGAAPTALHNNCSGKHAGFLALAAHLGVPADRYIDPASEGQLLVRRAIAEMSDVSESALYVAIDGCSAPTFQLPLTGLATAFARVSNPEGLAPERRVACERMLAAVAAHPNLIAGRHNRICSDLARIGGGKLFPKIGADGIYAVGIRGTDRALAVKLDDGGNRGLHEIVVALLARFGFLTDAEQEELAAWRSGPIRNWAGLEVGRVEVVH